MKISYVVAISPSRVIGKDGKMPWNEPEEMAHFRKLTIGHTVIMGRRTYDSLSRPLKKRRNIVITRSDLYEPNIEVYKDIPSLMRELQVAKNEIMVIGGAQIFDAFLPYVDKIYLSVLKKDYEGDVFLPEYENNLRLVEHKEFDTFDLYIYEK